MCVKTRVLASRLLIRLEQCPDMAGVLGVRAVLKEASSRSEIPEACISPSETVFSLWNHSCDCGCQTAEERRVI